MKREYVDYVKDIQDSIEKIEEFNKGLTFEEFEKDIKTVFATVRAFEIIGEASNKLPSDIKLAFQDIPWKKIVGMRNILVHEYFGVDSEAVWKAVQNDLPKLKPVINKMLDEIEKR